MQNLASTLGYFEDNWNTPGQIFIESKSFASLSTEEQTTLEDLGFYDYTWVRTTIEYREWYAYCFVMYLLTVENTYSTFVATPGLLHESLQSLYVVRARRS
jgi:hypothetical protein